MANFDIVCPDHYPMKCNLSQADKDYLLTNEKYKAFFIFQYKNQDVYSGENCHWFRRKVYHFVSPITQGNLQNSDGSFQPEWGFFDFLMDSPFRSIL